MDIDSERGLDTLSKGETEDEERTPRPTKEDKDQLHRIFDLSADDDEPFQTPLTLRRKKRAVKAVVVDSDPEEQLEGEGMKVAVKRKRGETGGIGKMKERKGDREKVIETLS